MDRSDMDVDVIGDPVDANQDRSPSISPTATAVDAASEVEVSEIVIQSDLPRRRKGRQNKAYVEIPRQKPPKRTASVSSSDLEWVEDPVPKKSRPSHQRAGEKEQRIGRGRSESRTEPGTTRPVSSNVIGLQLLSCRPCSSIASVLVANRRRGVPRKTISLRPLTVKTLRLLSQGQGLSRPRSSPSLALSAHWGHCRDDRRQPNASCPPTRTGALRRHAQNRPTQPRNLHQLLSPPTHRHR